MICIVRRCSRVCLSYQHLFEGFHAAYSVMTMFKDEFSNAGLAQGEEGDLLHKGLEVGGGSASNAISQVTGPQIALVDNTMLQSALSKLSARQTAGPGTSSGSSKYSDESHVFWKAVTIWHQCVLHAVIAVRVAASNGLSDYGQSVCTVFVSAA